MGTFLLVHGAWHGAWCWERLLPRLHARGHAAIAIDLPAHGDDTGSPWRATLRRYSERVRTAAAALPERPVLVGHSMGGIVITQAAHDAPDLFAGLAYLCAFVPLHGDSLIRLSRQDAASQVPRHLRTRPGGVRFDPRGAHETFCGECDDDTVRWAGPRLRPEPLWPLLQRVSARPPVALPRSYLACVRDRAISIAHQHAMAARAGVDRVVDLDTDHSPFLSRPDELAERLGELGTPTD